MADVNRGNRPLSPHLSIYRMAITMLVSILNRITGAGMALAAILIVWWLMGGIFCHRGRVLDLLVWHSDPCRIPLGAVVPFSGWPAPLVYGFRARL